MFLFIYLLGYVWLLKNLRKNTKEKKLIRKIKNKFKINKLLKYISSNLFYLFFLLYKD